MLKSLTLINLILGVFLLSQLGVNFIDSRFSALPSLLHFAFKWSWVLSLAIITAIYPSYRIRYIAILNHYQDNDTILCNT